MNQSQAIQKRMATERNAKIAKERKRIEAEDKIKFAADDKRAAEERAWVKEQVAVRKRVEEERAAMKAAAEKATVDQVKTVRVKGKHVQRAKSNAHATYKLGKRIDDDQEFIATVAKYLRKDAAATWQDVLAQMRADGIAGGTGRMARLFPQAQRAAKASSNGKANGKPKSKPAKK